MKHLMKESRPFQYMRSLQDELNRIMEDTFGEFNFPENLEKSFERTWCPAVELSEKEGKYCLKAELPGVSKDDIDINIDESSIILEAKTEKKHEEKQDGMYKSEFRYGKFYRRIEFPSDVDKDNAVAEFNNGILTISVPKLHIEEKKVKKLEIKE